MSRIFLAAWLMLGISSASAENAKNLVPCWQDKILNSSGMVIDLRSGQNFQAYPGSGATISGWQPLDKVTVCGIGGIAVSITNSSRKYQSVKALRVFPGNGGGQI